MSKSIILFIIFLTSISLILRFYRLAEPNHKYFDEVYHVVTAEAYARNDPAAYNPFAHAPEKGTAYDWLHPPLAKLIQAGSIKIIGDNPTGWRLPSVIFGTAIIPATFILTYLVFGQTAAVFAAFAIAFENLNLAMSRITMNDVFVTFFIVLSFIFVRLYEKEKTSKYLLLTAIFLGFSAASKWTGFYAVIVIFGFVITGDLVEKHFLKRNLLLVFVPLLVYVASYGQFWLQGHNVTDFINLHKQIWWYQNRHDLAHPYGTTPLYCVPKGLNGSKTFCPWVFDVRGVYFSYEQYGQKAGYIYAIGNPLIYWFGFASVCFLLFGFLKKRSKGKLLILLGYSIFWVPWIFSPRILFMYHYLPSIPFLSAASGLVLSKIWKNGNKVVVIGIIVLFALTFFYFYPISTGFPIKTAVIDSYMWFKTWR